MLEDKYIGLALAFSSSAAIGSSFIITKKGLNDAAGRAPEYPHSHQRQTGPRNASDDLAYLQNPIWWAGMITMVIGEVANFAAYTFAPAILVTPLGAMSVIIGAILASFLLDEKLGRLGVCGCASCIIGSVVIILHAPSDKEVTTVDEILSYASRLPFLIYIGFVAIFSSIMIFRVAPRYGQTNPMVYLSICSLVGSVSVMAIKGFGIALKLTFAGNNQLTHISTYVFGAVVVGCILVQMNYFNKALDTFSTNVVNPIYYVFFTTATITASAILFQGFNTTDAVNTLSLLCGFLIIFMGVYLLNISRQPEAPQPHQHHHSSLETGLMSEYKPLEMEGTRNMTEKAKAKAINWPWNRTSASTSMTTIAAYTADPRMSMSGRMSSDSQGPTAWGSLYANDTQNGHGRRSSLFRQQNSTLFNAFEEEGMALTQLPEEEDEEEDESRDRYGNRTLVGARRDRDVDGGRHPAYQEV